MKRLILLIRLVIVIAVLVASPAFDTSGLLTANTIPEEQTTISQTEVGDSSASAGITITMYAVDDE